MKLAKYYDFFIWPLELIGIRNLRKPLISSLRGKILEIGAGTGRNLEYYDKKADITLTDYDPEMILKAKERGKWLGVNAKYSIMPAEKLKFKNSNFDIVVSTLTLCSVNNPVRALKEMKRVCKKSGIIVLIEHAKSERKWIYYIQAKIKPVFKRYFGCCPDRDILSFIKAAGMKPLSVKNVMLDDVFKEIIIKNKK